MKPEDSYRTQAELIYEYKVVGIIPMELQIPSVFSVEKLAADYFQNDAKWHKSCRLKFSQTILERSHKGSFEHGNTNRRCSLGVVSVSNHKGQCVFFCDENASKAKPLHQVQTKEADSKMKECVTKLRNLPLNAKLSEGDMIARDAMYHNRCLASLYNKVRTRLR